MKRSTPVSDTSEPPTSIANPPDSSGNIPSGDGSIRYRIAVLLAMLLLAVTAMVIWFYLRAN